MSPMFTVARASVASTAWTGMAKYISSPHRLTRDVIGSASQTASAVAEPSRDASIVTPPAVIEMTRVAMALSLSPIPA